MKIRYGFISNSSSTSFVIDIDRSSIHSYKDLRKLFKDSITDRFDEKTIDEMLYSLYAIIESNDIEELFDILESTDRRELIEYLTNHTMKECFNSKCYIDYTYDNDFEDFLKYLKSGF